MRTSYDAEKAMPLRSARPRERREDRPRRERRAWTPPGGDAGMDAAAQVCRGDSPVPANFTGLVLGCTEDKFCKKHFAVSVALPLQVHAY